jgi:hypothetical protein
MAMTDIEVAAMRIFNAYRDEMNERGALSGNFPATFFKATGVTAGYFRAAGEACIKQGLNPEDYIELAFSQLTKNINYVTPKDIVGVKQVVAAQQRQQAAGLRAPNEWIHMCKEVTLRAARLIPKPYTDIVDILMDPMQPFTSYFRVLYLEQLYECLLEMYGDRAYAELAPNTRLRAYLRTVRGPQLERFERVTARFGNQILEGGYNG